jgi:hypothetical protein
MSEKFDIRKLSVNPENPRTASEFMEGKLIESILVFPKMLEVRPIVVNKENTVLGGNMRLAMLKRIVEMDNDEIEDYLFNQKKFRLMSNSGKEDLKKFWADFKKKPIVPIRRAENFTDNEEREFLIKDNLHYGEDDVDILKHNFDRESISDYTGSVPWNLYDYDDKMNDKELNLTKKFPEHFKCGYVDCQMTNAEYEALCKLFAEYLEQHDGNGDGFLSFLLS